MSTPLSPTDATRPTLEAAPKAKSPRVAPKLTLEEKFAKLGLVSEWDFAFYAPLRYEDLTRITPIGELHEEGLVQVQGTIVHATSRLTRIGPIFLITLEDDSGQVEACFFSAYPGIEKQLATHKRVRLAGELKYTKLGHLQLSHPKIYDYLDDPSTLPDRLTPIYGLTQGLQQRTLRKRIARTLLDLEGTADLVPQALLSQLNLPTLQQALQFIHTPPVHADVAALQSRQDPHWRRLKLDELLAQQIMLSQARVALRTVSAPCLTAVDNDYLTPFIASLPFELTGAQQRVWREIEVDLARTHPMNRLVQGDVGCGKTIVATLAALRAVEAHTQAALMAPTSVLAEQHYQKLSAWLTPLGLHVVLLTSALPAAARRQALSDIQSGRAHIVVGTHALLTDHVQFHRLGLSIIDEQHRFGVAQRFKIRQSTANEQAHLLMMSATPIPRSLAMSYLSDLDVSSIDELPPGRTPVLTRTVKLERTADIYGLILGFTQKGQQVYWVCPLIEESEALTELASAQARLESLQLALPNLRIGLLHGAMKPSEKDEIMLAFKNHALDVLVSTTVIEVGVDVPNATLMVIENAERFGLATLHQLRGRVGRGCEKSMCILAFNPQLSWDGRLRLKTMLETNDGFEIANKDLQMRGPGDFLGEQQSGVPILRVADISNDTSLVTLAQSYAQQWLHDDPDTALKHAQRWFSHQAPFLAA